MPSIWELFLIPPQVCMLKNFKYLECWNLDSGTDFWEHVGNFSVFSLSFRPGAQLKKPLQTNCYLLWCSYSICTSDNWACLRMFKIGLLSGGCACLCTRQWYTFLSRFGWIYHISFLQLLCGRFYRLISVDCYRVVFLNWSCDASSVLTLKK